MPKEYEEIKNSLRKAHPDWSADKVEEMASRTFAKIFGTNPQHAHKLAGEGKWESYKKSHSKGGKEIEDGTYEIFTSGFQFKEEPDGDYIEGFVSTPELDLGNDIVQCQKEIVEQLTSNSLANKLSYRHDWLADGKDPKTVLEQYPPLGKCIHAEIREHTQFKEAAWARYKLNKNYPNYEKVKEEIKQGFADGFSIEYKAISTISKQLGNVVARVINAIKIIGVGLAARPMNPSSVLTGFMLKEYEYVGDGIVDTQSNKLAVEKEEKEVDLMDEELKKELEAKELAIKKYEDEKKEMTAKLEALQKEVSIKSSFEAELKEIKAKEKVLAEKGDIEKKEEAEKVAAETKEYFEKPNFEKAAAIIKSNKLW